MFSSEQIESQVTNLTSETSSYEVHFENTFQAKFDIYDQSFEKQEEYLIEFKEKKPYGIKHVIIKTHLKLSAYSHL